MSEGYNSIRMQSGKHSAIRKVSDAADKLHLALYQSGVFMEKRYERIEYALTMATASRNLGATKKILGPVWPDISRKLFKEKKLFSEKEVNSSYAALSDFLEQ